MRFWTKSQWNISTYVPNGRNSEKVRFVRQLMVKRHPGFCVVPTQKTRGCWLFPTIVTRSCKRYHPNLTNKTKSFSQFDFFPFCRFLLNRINQHVVRFMEGEVHRISNFKNLPRVFQVPKITAQHFRSNSLWSSCRRYGDVSSIFS